MRHRVLVRDGGSVENMVVGTGSPVTGSLLRNGVER